MEINVSNDVHPYRRFTLILGTSVLLFGVILFFVSSWMIGNFVINDTVNLTKTEIAEHFAMLSQFSNLLAPAAAASSANSSSITGYGESGSSTADTHDHGTDVSGDAATNLVQTIKMHFDIYKITETNFYTLDGNIKFSYNKDAIGDTASSVVKIKIAEAYQDGLKGTVSHLRLPGHLLNLWIPIKNKSGQIELIAEITRDVSAQDKDVQGIQLAVMAIIIAGMLVLFFSLRQIFIRSSTTIDQKNKALKELVFTIERTYDESLQALSAALDSRDNETHGHSFRVTSYAILVGKEMGLSDTELGSLARGALLHDVGKIGVPDAILLKPAKLTEEEWRVMKSHVRIGFEMLNHIDFLQSSLDVVKYHHERCDGGGYPYGLSNDEIPLFASIFSLCDTYDAITSDRPYRKGKNYEAAKEEIIRCVGTQFRKEVVDAFLRIPERSMISIQMINHSSESYGTLKDMVNSVNSRVS